MNRKQIFGYTPEEYPPGRVAPYIMVFEALDDGVKIVIRNSDGVENSIHLPETEAEELSSAIFVSSTHKGF